jgi:nucleoid-associated protein YgaU
MPTDKSKKPASAKAPRSPKNVDTKKEVIANNTPAEQPERQSQFATILIGLLIIASGLLIYNYFQSVNQPATTTNEQAQNQTKSSDKSQSSPTPTPTKSAKPQQQPNATAEKYTVVAGDSLWSVAENVYGDGHQWHKIADANSLQSDAAGRPVIEVGQVLSIPGSSTTTGGNVAQAPSPTPTPTVTEQPTNNGLSQTPDTGIQEYTVRHGDTLWSVAEQVYGDGHQWRAIFDDPHNRLGLLPGGQPLIHAGNTLYIPQLR